TRPSELDANVAAGLQWPFQALVRLDAKALAEQLTGGLDVVRSVRQLKMIVTEQPAAGAERHRGSLHQAGHAWHSISMMGCVDDGPHAGSGAALERRHDRRRGSCWIVQTILCRSTEPRKPFGTM